jgi:hypothetical protein
MLFSGIATVREWYDDDAQCFRVAVDVHNSVWGPLFGYRGSFNVEWRKVTAVSSVLISKCPSHNFSFTSASSYTITRDELPKF